MSINDSNSLFFPAFSNLNPINDTKNPELHKVKTGQNRPSHCGGQQIWAELSTVLNADEMENSPTRR